MDQLTYSRPLSKVAARMRYIRVRRLPHSERKRLGLEPGVGYSEAELTRFRYYAALELAILKETHEAELTPLQAIGFDGRAPVVEFIHDVDKLPEELRGLRNVNSSPIDYLFFQSKNPIAFWEWLAGKRFEHDMHQSRRDAPVTASLATLENSKVEKLTAAQRRVLVTFRPRKAKRPKAGYAVADARLDAIARLGRLQDSVSSISFWLLEQVIGQERTLAETAQKLGVDQRYTAQRFREALWEAAGHYRMMPASKPRPRN